MRISRLTTATAALPATFLALVLAAALAPAYASAGSLLSGYGGPGQGNQEILGSALLNGPAGKGGSGGGGSGPGTGAAAGGGTALTGAAAGAGSVEAALAAPAGETHGSTAARPGGTAAGGRHADRRAPHASIPAARTYNGASSPARTHAGGGGSQTLGLSGADLLYILIALGVLAVTGGLTRRLVRQPA
jgi:hypothetical protein